MKISVEKAGKTDQVVDTVNYKTITKEVLYHVENKKYNLIETVATDVARICVVRHEVPVVKVTVKKPNSLRFARASTVTIQRRFDDFDWKDVHVSIGSNINPLDNVPRAIELLQKKCSIVKLSKAFVTTPVIDEDQADFVNMAVLIRTKLDPEGLKLFMYDIENQLGRQRDPLNKNAPRAIDLDIAFWEDNLLEYKLATNGSTKSWSLPDPDIIKYAHVIVPLADISPAFIHPLEKKPLSVMAENITGKQDFVSFFPKICLENNRHRSNPKAPISNNCARPIGISTQAGSGPLDEATPRPVALVTGGSKRLGAAIARRLHQVGYNVVVHYNLSVVQSSKLVKELNSLRVNSARAVQADLTTDVQKTAEKIIQESLGEIFTIPLSNGTT
ncbi:hypothetical protein QZH41_003404 [Actinostola sp. cb2023]|nr:hypothetical protein QZH41_003404 [Actinostola sp. cb2023]